MIWGKKFRTLLLVVVLASASFALSRTPPQTRPIIPTKDSFSFVVFGDNQDGYKTFKGLIKKVNQEKIDFAVHVGDTVQRATKKDFQNYLKMTSKLKPKLYQVPGNHDLAGNGYKYYKKYFGPFYYSFDHKNSHFIVLNNAFASSFTANQFAWLKKDLAATDKENIFVFLHRPVFDPSEIFTGYVMSGREVTEELMRLFDRYKVDYVFAGHIHCYAKVGRGTVYIISGGAGGQLHLPRELGGFHHYVKINVAGDKISDEVIRIYD